MLQREQVDAAGQLAPAEEAGKEKAVAVTAASAAAVVGREDGSVEVSIEVKRELEEARTVEQYKCC